MSSRPTDLTAAPTANMLDTLKNIVPSFFVGQNTISDASTFVRPPSLRGLPPDEVLVMLNGKRFNRSALVQVFSGGESGLAFGSHGSDLSSIPSIGIKNLQILREGATAQYGSDAIAGVLNYALRDDAGYELIGRYGQYYEGDGESYQIAGNVGFRFADSGFINLSGEYFDDGETSRGETRPIAVIFAEENPDLEDELPHFPRPAQIWGNSPSHGYKFMLNSGIDLTRQRPSLSVRQPRAHRGGPELQLPLVADRHAAGHGIRRDQHFHHECRRTGILPAPLSIKRHARAANPTCPAGGFVLDGNTFFLSSIYPAGFTPRFVGVTDQAFGAVGVKGSSGAFRWDVSTSLARNKLDLSMYDSISPSYGPSSQTSFEFGKQIQKEWNGNLDVAYELRGGPRQPDHPFGRRGVPQGNLQDDPGRRAVISASDPGRTRRSMQGLRRRLHAALEDPIRECVTVGTVLDPRCPNCVYIESPAASGYGGTSPTFAGSDSEFSWGVYGGAEADVTEQLTLGAAVRYEHYESFGGTTVFKVNGKYDFSDAFSVRGTVGTGFHAPSPGQNNAQVLTTNFLFGQSVQVGTYPVTSEIAQYFGAESLKPAKATNYGLGFVFTPAGNTTLTVDAYSIKVRDRIFISQPFFVTAADIVALPALASVGVGGTVQYFTNSLRHEDPGHRRRRHASNGPGRRRSQPDARL